MHAIFLQNLPIGLLTIKSAKWKVKERKMALVQHDSMQEFSDSCIFVKYANIIWTVSSKVLSVFNRWKTPSTHLQTRPWLIYDHNGDTRDSRIFTITLSFFSIFPSFFETVKSSLTVVIFATLCLAKLQALNRERLKLYNRSYELRNSGHFFSFAPVYNDPLQCSVITMPHSAARYSICTDATLFVNFLYDHHHKYINTTHVHILSHTSSSSSHAQRDTHLIHQKVFCTFNN